MGITFSARNCECFQVDNRWLVLSKTQMMYTIQPKAIILILIYNFNLAFHMQIEFRNHNTVLYPLEVLANIEFCVPCLKDVTLILLETNALACQEQVFRIVLAYWVELQNKTISWTGWTDPQPLSYIPSHDCVFILESEASIKRISLTLREKKDYDVMTWMRKVPHPHPGSAIWTLGSQLVMLFGEVPEPLSGGAFMEEVCRWGKANFLFALCVVLVVREVNSQLPPPSLSLPAMPPCHGGLLASGITSQNKLFLLCAALIIMSFHSNIKVASLAGKAGHKQTRNKILRSQMQLTPG